MAEKEEKNLEAQDQVYRGIFRAPFAFLIGGPLGLIANGAYTAAKAKHEVDRENEHKKYLESLKPKPRDPVEVKKEADRREQIRLFLWNEFAGIKKLDILDGSAYKVYDNQYCPHDPFVDAPKAFHVSLKEDGFVSRDGISYCLEDFYKIYMSDKDDPSMKKYNISGNHCYKVDSKPYFVINRGV